MVSGGTGQDGSEKADLMRVDNFDAQARPITPEDRALLHELTVGVFWPHRAHDLDVFISLGEGYLAIDEIGRPLGSAMYFTAGEDLAMLGMMVTAPRLQARGTGRWLLRRVRKDCGTRDLRLSATHSGYRLYESEGFIPLGVIRQHQGLARVPSVPETVPGTQLRPLTPADIPALRELDRIAYGTERKVTLDMMLKLSSGMVIERGGEICGFALLRKFGRGVVIGPLVAEDERMAMALAFPLIRQHEGKFVRLDTSAENERLSQFLTEAGMRLHDTVTEMYMGQQRRALEGTRIFGLASHSLG